MRILNTMSRCRPNHVAMACLMLFLFISQVAICQTYTVNTTADSGAGSLRDAINEVNLGAYDIIDFDIPTGDAGYNAQNNTWTIQPSSDLPSIVKTVTIDGYSQPGSSLNTILQGNNAVLTIVLNGEEDVSDGYTGGNGLHFLAGSDESIVEGLVINGWALNGILIDGTNGSINGIQVIGNFIGTDATGTVSIPTRTGVGISGAVNSITNTQVGTANSSDRNLFGGSFGYLIFDSYVIRGACICSCYNTGTAIVNNYIGTDLTGKVALGLSQCGVMLIAESDSTIGGSVAAELNLIAGQTIYGINLTSTIPAQFILPIDETVGCSSCSIEGNYIGTDVLGTYALGNGNAGVAIDSFAVDNQVFNNLISGNRVGIQLGQYDLPGSMNNLVQGNFIGTDATGTVAIPNTDFGIRVNDSNNIVGGTSTGEMNLISGNVRGGIFVFGTTGVTLSGNYIGTDVTGTFPLPNGGNGIVIGANGPSSCAATDTTIGL